MQRLIAALANSLRALRRLARHETAFRQEVVVLAAALPLGWLLAASWREYLVLIGVVFLVLLVEVLNTGIEAACDALSREFHAEIQFAKDCGSLAVLIAILVAALVWSLVLAERISGTNL